MLSVSRDDGRKGVGLGFGGGRAMEENELEEGEACSGQEDDACIDPDITLSYIGEKIQDVLGHFQKDFEGGVSVENLGARFGGYGSFLPAYQRSPSIWSQPRSPPKAPASHNSSRSPYNPPFEGARQNPSVPTSASISKNNTASTAPPLYKSGKNESGTNTLSAGDAIPLHDSFNKSVNSSEQNTLKVRIKVGPDNVSSRNNAAIYSGLGLDISPSSSLEDSPDGSGELSPEFEDAPASDESPMTILQIMTCFSVPGGFLLSPLPDSLLRLIEKGSPSLKDGKTGKLCKSIAQTYAVLADETPPIRDVKGFVEKKMKSFEKNGKSMEVRNPNVSDEITLSIKKETGNGIPAGQKLVSNTLDIPLSTSSSGLDGKAERRIIGDSAKGASRISDLSREPNKVSVRDSISSPDLTKEDKFESTESMENNWVGDSGNETTYSKGKVISETNSAEKALEGRKTTSHADASVDLRREVRSKFEKNYDTVKSNSDGFKGKKDHVVGPAEPIKQKSAQKAASHELEGEKMMQGKDQLSESKRKTKGSQINGTPSAEFPKENLRASSSAALTEKKKSSHTRNDLFESKSKTLKSHKESSRVLNKDCQTDLVGDIKAEQVENRTDLLEAHLKDKLKDMKLENEEFIEKPKERPGGKKVDNTSPSEASLKASVDPPLTYNAPTLDVVAVPNVPVVIKENWVGCDRCQKWRLLPYETNPNALPKKWLCSMLTWLPGMNRCSVSQDETTKALNALYHIPAPESDVNRSGHQNVAASSMIVANAHHLDQSPEQNMQTMPSTGKKKHGQKDASNVPNNSALVQLSNSVKKNQQTSIKSRSVNDVNHYPLESNSLTKVGFENTSKSTDFATEKHKYKQKEKHKILGTYSDGAGDFIAESGKHSKSKSKREVDQDGLRTSKKIKIEGSHPPGEDWHSDHDVSGKAVSNMGNGLSTKINRKNLQENNEFSSSVYSKCDAKDNLRVSSKKSKVQVQVFSNGEMKEHFSSSDMEKPEKKDLATKKRKVEEWQDSQGNQETLISSQHLVNDGTNVQEELSESKLRKEKKAKLSRSEAKDPDSTKADGRLDKKACVTKILLSGTREPLADRMEGESRNDAGKDHQVRQYQESAASQRALDSIDSLKRDLGYAQPSTAATSSSSKVSGSHKSKSYFQEMRGSPVESVSSSPLRISNTENLSTRRNLTVKNDARNAGLSVMGSPKRCSDDDVDGRIDRSETRRKDKASSVQRRLLESHRAAELGIVDSLRGPCDYQHKKASQLSGDKAKVGVSSMAFGGSHDALSPSGFEDTNVASGAALTPDQRNKYVSERQDKDHGHGQDKLNNHHRNNGSSQRKSGKSSSHFKERHRSSKYEVDKGKLKVPDSFNEREEWYPTKNSSSSRFEADIDPHDEPSYHEDLKDENYNFQEKKDFLGKKDFMGKLSAVGKRDNHSNSGLQETSDVHGPSMVPKQHKDLNPRVAAGASCGKGGKSSLQENLQQTPSHEYEKLSDRFLSDQIDQSEMASGRGKSQSFLPSREKQETLCRGPHTVSTPVKGSRSEIVLTDVANGDASKVANQPRKPDSQNGAQQISLRQTTPNGLDAKSPVRKDGLSAANVVLKEARELKHMANRLKDEGQELEKTGLYFQAALKFLHVASLWEPSNAESAKHGETAQSMNMYSDTAKLCEYCARDFEKCKEMASAALAYKCMEVAYMKVGYFKHSSASKDRQELQTALKMVLPGESPSSSASDVDNLNNQGALDKAVSAKAVSSPQITGKHVIAARNRPNFLRLLEFTNDAILAMEASRKSQNAIAAASASLEEAHYGVDGISSVRKVLDFNFHDIEGLLRLVRLSMESISR